MQIVRVFIVQNKIWDSYEKPDILRDMIKLNHSYDDDNAFI